MTRDTRMWLVIMLLGAAGLIGRAVFSEQGMAREYVRVVPVAPDSALTQENASTYGEYVRAQRANPAQTEYRFSGPRTVGLWISAFFTLAVFSFLYRDNPFYKVAESVLVGVSAAYWMVIGFWDVLVPNLIGKIWPAVVQAWAMPGLSGPEAVASPSYIVALVLSVMLLWRLAPRGGWISRWPLAFVVGTTAGLKLIGFLHGDFLVQIRNTILPLVVLDAGQVDFWASVQNLLIVVSVLCCLVYFFFSFEHSGAVGAAAKVGIWVLMITFGAAFGYTVMGRIALLAIRFEFLLDDWLWLIDPGARRVVSVIFFGVG
jgi:hypothetical protein